MTFDVYDDEQYIALNCLVTRNIRYGCNMLHIRENNFNIVM